MAADKARAAKIQKDMGKSAIKMNNNKNILVKVNHDIRRACYRLE